MKKRMEAAFLRHGITVRIVLSFILFVILPFLALAVVVVNTFQDYSYRNLGNATMDAMSSVGFQVAKEIRSRKEDSLFVYYKDIVKLLEKEQLTNEEQENIIKELNASIYSMDGISACCIVDKNGNAYGTGSYASLLRVMEEHKEEIEQAGGKCCWYVTNRLYVRAGAYKYILARRLNGRDGKMVGYLYLVMGDSLVTDAFDQLNSSYAVRYLVDENGRILYSSEHAKTGEMLDIHYLDSRKSSSYQRVSLSEDREALVVSQKIWETGWYCITVTEIRDIRQNAMKLLKPFGFMTVIYILFLFVMLYMLRRYVFHPLGLLKKTMDQYAQGGLQTMEIEPVGVGELKSLSNHFNRMTVRIDNLMRSYREEEEEKNRQKLMVLSAQLTPHFIYNALNTIKWMAVLNHQENIQKLTESLIYIFMNSAKIEERGYTVSDELKLIENYAIIQKARFMNFDLVINAQEDCLELRIRKLLLQPIVENAIVHGLGRGKIKNTKIQIRVWGDKDLHIEIEDHGVGFDVNRWRQEPEKKEGHTNIGISSVEKMIHMEYGEPYGLWIDSRQNEGTKVTYLLPKVAKEEPK